MSDTNQSTVPAAIRIPLLARAIPFDSRWSKQLCDLIMQEESLAASLNIGEIRWIRYDYDTSVERGNYKELVFDLHGREGNVTVVAEYENSKFLRISSIHRLHLGAKGQILYSQSDTKES